MLCIAIVAKKKKYMGHIFGKNMLHILVICVYTYCVQHIGYKNNFQYVSIMHSH